MAQYSVGPSSYGDLNGVTQYVNSQRIAQQFLSMARDYRDKFGKSGNHLTVNEGMRSRPRQDLLYRKYLVTGYPVAAVPYNSRHDAVTRGNAIDVGVTEKDGSNRALTSAEFDWMHTQAERRGFTWTGRYFNEPWHIEGATRAEIVAPYAGVTPENVYQAPTPEPDDQEEQVRKALMAAADTLTYFQRVGTDGKDQNVYFIAGPGIFVDIVSTGTEDGKQWLVARTGLTSSAIRTVLNREGVKAVKLPARDFDERRTVYAALAEAAQGKVK